MLNDIENKVLDLHEKFKEKFGVNKYENLVGANLYFNNIYEKSIVSSLNIDGKSEQNGTPTPDEPVEIKSVEGVNSLLKNTKINSGDGNYWSVYSTFDEATRTLTRSTTATTESFITHMINNLKSNTTYTLFLEAKSNGYVKSMDLHCYNKSVQGHKYETRLNLSTEFKKYSFTFTTDKDVDYSEETTIRIDNNGSTTSGTEAILTVKNVTLVEGTYNSYVPYGHWVTVTNTGKNSCGITSLTGYQFSNALPVIINTNFVITEFDSNNFSYSVASNSYLLGLTNIFRLKPNTNYTLSFTRTDTGISSGRCYIYNVSNDGTYTVSQNCNGTGSLSKTFTTGDNGLIALGIGVGNNSSGGSGTVNNIMIEKGTELTSYEPYQEQSMLIDMNKYDENGNIIDYYELCSIDNTKDELNIDKDGNVSVTQNIGEVVLNGSETWATSMAPVNEGVKAYQIPGIGSEIKVTNESNGYSSHFIVISGGSKWNTSEHKNSGYCRFTSNNLYIRISEILAPDLETLKTWLSTHPVTVKYILTEPQTISLGKMTPLKLLEGTNNITTNDELQPNMTSSINCLNLVETSLRNIQVNDYLNNKTIHLSFPFESYENIDNTEHIFIIINENLYFCYKPNHPIAPTAKHISYKYKDRYNFLYHKYNTDLNSDFNYIRYKLPKDYGKVSSINENDIFYKFIKIKDDEYKLQEYNKKTWIDNEIPYLQYIDNIEEGINNVAEILYKPLGYEYKKWTTTGYYGIKSNDYGLAQKPISSKDFDRWNRNIELLKNTINSINNIWNVVSYIDWDEISQFEWEEN
ncbi:MAG: hypothetical protein Q4E39_05285 [bacterium]|nr:hypothetical protein [bacterium]